MKVELTSFLIILTTISCLTVCAQDVAAKLDAFNEAIGKEYNVTNKGRVLVVAGFREGKQVKEDKVNVFDLDLETLKYSETDNTVSVNCYSDFDGCVTSVLLLDKKKSHRIRLVFAVPSGTPGSEIIEKLKLLLNDMCKKY